MWLLLELVFHLTCATFMVCSKLSPLHCIVTICILVILTRLSILSCAVFYAHFCLCFMSGFQLVTIVVLEFLSKYAQRKRVS